MSIFNSTSKEDQNQFLLLCSLPLKLGVKQLKEESRYSVLSVPSTLTYRVLQGSVLGLTQCSMYAVRLEKIISAFKSLKYHFSA